MAPAGQALWRALSATSCGSCLCSVLLAAASFLTPEYRAGFSLWTWVSPETVPRPLVHCCTRS
eukprot:2247202-Amphidinium_carterae.2